MPDPTLMNFMQQKIDNPVSEQVRGQRSAAANDYANMQNTLADIDMKQMANSATRKKQTLLENFEGKTGSPEFYEKMGTVDPDLVMQMQEHANNMDAGQREKAKEYFDKVAARAEMAKTPDQWSQAGFKVPFDQRDRILGAALTYQQAFDRTKEANNLAGAGGAGGLKAADENAIQKYSQALFKGVYNPITGGFMGFKKDVSRQQAAQVATDASRFAKDDPNMTLHEAVMMAAKKNGVEFEEKQDPGPAQGEGGKPQGDDFSYLWKAQ